MGELLRTIFGKAELPAAIQPAAHEEERPMQVVHYLGRTYHTPLDEAYIS